MMKAGSARMAGIGLLRKRPQKELHTQATTTLEVQITVDTHSTVESETFGNAQVAILRELSDAHPPSTHYRTSSTRLFVRGCVWLLVAL
jgi:hypothetical protein